MTVGRKVMLIVKVTPCQARCWVLNTNNLSCTTNNPVREVTIYMPVLQMKKLKFRGVSLPKVIKLLKEAVRM